MFKEFEPSQEEIAQACQEIQAGWSESERRSRVAGNVSLTKFKTDGVAAAARFEVEGKLATKRAKLRQTKA